MVFVREKKITCGDYMEVDIIPRTLEAERVIRRGTRSKKEKVSAPKQQNLNQKNAKRYLVELGNGNFGKGDLHVTLTYSNEFRPETVEEAEKEVTNYLRRVAYRRKKLGLSALKYILVSEYRVNDDGEFTTKIHHHIIMNGDETNQLTRDDIEQLWSKRVKGKGKQQLGWADADRLQPNENGIEALLTYLSKDPKGKKRWSSSRNLVRPFQRKNDFKYSNRKIEQLAKTPDQGLEYFQQKYPKYRIASVEFKYYDRTGWHAYLKLWKVIKRDRK